MPLAADPTFKSTTAIAPRPVLIDPIGGVRFPPCLELLKNWSRSTPLDLTAVSLSLFLPFVHSIIVDSNYSGRQVLPSELSSEKITILPVTSTVSNRAHITNIDLSWDRVHSPRTPESQPTRAA